jgi:hypothetical protein
LVQKQTADRDHRKDGKHQDDNFDHWLLVRVVLFGFVMWGKALACRGQWVHDYAGRKFWRRALYVLRLYVLRLWSGETCDFATFALVCYRICKSCRPIAASLMCDWKISFGLSQSAQVIL